MVIPFESAVQLSTLADDTVLTNGLFTLGEDFFVISIDARWSIDDLTLAQGPISVGWSHGDLTVTEVREQLVAETTDPDDIVSNEHRRRPVRKAGMFSGAATSEVLNDGKAIRSKFRRSIGDGHLLRFWAWNNSGAALSTTDPLLTVVGNIYGRWQR